MGRGFLVRAIASLSVLWLAAASSAQGLTVEALKNLTYRINARTVTLTNGKFHSGRPVLNPDYMIVEFRTAAFGDLDSDGYDDAAVILAWSGGGSGVFYELAAVVNRKTKLFHVASVQLGDRVVIKDLTISSGKIVVDMVEHGPTDAMCCPTKRTVRTYALSGNLLVPL